MNETKHHGQFGKAGHRHGQSENAFNPFFVDRIGRFHSQKNQRDALNLFSMVSWVYFDLGVTPQNEAGSVGAHGSESMEPWPCLMDMC